jgi:hypothetical protein
MKRLLVTLAAAAAATVLAGSAFADVIDGMWCNKDGLSLTIDGPSIITPGGNRITGQYGRHSFLYTVPANEKGAGGPMNLILLNEETVNLWLGSGLPEPAAVEVWRRCKPVA